MKAIFSLLLVMISSVVLAQQPSVKQVRQPTVITPKVLTPAKVSMTQTDSLFREMEIKLNELTAITGKLKKSKEAMNELSEEEQLQLQRLMDRKNKLDAMISNLMKSFKETSDSIIKNIKG